MVSPLGLMPTSWASLLVPLPRVSSIVLPGPDAGPALLTAAVGEGSANSPSLMTSGPVLPASGFGKGKRSSLPFPPHHMVDEGCWITSALSSTVLPRVGAGPTRWSAAVSEGQDQLSTLVTLAPTFPGCSKW